jgi:DNA-binding NtrC family response regulator
MLAQPSLALINNEPTFRWTVSRLLEDRGYAVMAFDRQPDAVEHVRQQPPGAVILEATYGSAVTAVAIVERLRADRVLRYIPVVVCSPDGRFLHSYGEFLRGQGCVVIGRPFNEDRLIEVVDRAVSLSAAPVYGALTFPAHQPVW